MIIDFEIELNCNTKVNKDREMWTLYFQNFLENEYNYKIGI